MKDSKTGNKDISNLLNNVYRYADKSSWYSSVAQAYDRTRPRYPAKLIDRVREIAELKPGKKVLEIGSGPGIASIEFAKLGVETIGIEPSLAACEIARRKCADYPNIEFINSTFEDWSTSQKFDAVVATTSFHWITPEIRCQKSASVLNNDGYLVLLWNTPPEPSEEVCQSAIAVYQTHAPDIAQRTSIQEYRENLGKFGRKIIDSGYFKDLFCQQIISQVTYSVDEYLTLLTTLSPYIKLEPSRRNTLLTELKKVLESNYGDRLELSYLSMLQIARKSFYSRA